MFCPVSVSALGGALGTHAAMTPAGVHTHTCRRARACRHAVKAALCSHLIIQRPVTQSVKGEVLKKKIFSDDLSHRVQVRHVEASIGNKETSSLSSPLLFSPSHMLWDNRPVTLIRNELDGHESQHMLDEGRWNAACSGSTCCTDFSYMCVCALPVCALWRNLAGQARCHVNLKVLVLIWYLISDWYWGIFGTTQSSSCTQDKRLEVQLQAMGLISKIVIKSSFQSIFVLQLKLWHQY